MLITVRYRGYSIKSKHTRRCAETVNDRTSLWKLMENQYSLNFARCASRLVSSLSIFFHCFQCIPTQLMWRAHSCARNFCEDIPRGTITGLVLAKGTLLS